MDIPTLSDEQKAGQRIMAGFNGTHLNDEMMFLVDQLKVGGIILFAANITSPGQLTELCASIQYLAVSCGQPPLFIAVDQEGGQVARLKAPFTEFRGNPYMTGLKDAKDFALTTAEELSEVGINMNMAPVMDVAFNNDESIMAGRVFGNDPGWVAQMGAHVIEHLQKNKIMAVAKHFPGIGRTCLDSHLDLPVLDIDRATLEDTDLLPFETAAACDVAGTMLSHIRYPQIDPDWPTSLSKIIAKEMLRDYMEYDGLVMTDDLDMGAISKHYDFETVMRRILIAEIDITLICHMSDKIQFAYDTILQAYREDQELEGKGEVSLRRIMKLKQDYLNFEG